MFGHGFTPRNRMRLLWSYLFGGPVGPPPPSRLFVVVPCANGWSSALLVHGGPIDYALTGLGWNRNGLRRSRHLLPKSAIRPQANLKKALNPQDAKVFPQVRFERSQLVVIL